MKNHLSLAVAIATALHLTASAQAQIVINEIDSDTFNTPGTDYAEFIELFSLSRTATPLDGLTLVLFNGSNDQSYAAIDLDGLSTDDNGYFVFGTTSVASANNTSLLGGGNFLQNGADAVALYTGNATSFPTGTAPTTMNLVDAIVYGTGDANDTGLLTALGETVQFDEGGSSPANDAANLSLSRIPNGSGDFIQATPTPDMTNIPEPSSMALLGAGAVAVLLRRRRR